MSNYMQGTKYVGADKVGDILIKGGTSSTYRVSFEKQAGGFSSVTGLLVKPIEGDLDTRVVMLNEEGNYKSFNPSYVTSIEVV